MVGLKDRNEFLKKYIAVVEAVWGDVNRNRLTPRMIEFFVSYIVNYNGEEFLNETRKTINKEMRYRGRDYYVWRDKLMAAGWIRGSKEGYRPIPPFEFKGVIPTRFTLNEVIAIES